MNDKKVVIICSIILFLLSLNGLYRKYTGENYKESSLYRYDRPLMEWVRGNTPENAIFLIPIYFHSWQGTKRPAFYDANIINGASYNKVYIMDAIKRFQILMDVNLKDVSLEKLLKWETSKTWSANSFQRERYDNMTEDRITEIKGNYGMKYFITASERRYPFPVVYQNDKYRIYNLN